MKKRMNIVMVALLTILASCSTNYQMVTRVHKDGTVEKEVLLEPSVVFLLMVSSTIFFPGSVLGHTPSILSRVSYSCSSYG